jgi:hypothetical protein
MTVTTLDAKTALIVVDLQKGIVSMAAGQAMAGAVKQVAASRSPRGRPMSWASTSPSPPTP